MEAENRSQALFNSEFLRFRYRGFRVLLAKNSEMLEKMADLEAELSAKVFDEYRIRLLVNQLLSGSLLLAEELNLLADNKFLSLYTAYQEIESELTDYFQTVLSSPSQPLLLPLNQANRQSAYLVGSKAANLGELYSLIKEAIIPGFIITTAGYRLFLSRNNLRGRIRALLSNLEVVAERELFQKRTAEIQALIESAVIPAEIKTAIKNGLLLLPEFKNYKWAVRSSEVGEDGIFSFAGQFETILNVEAEELEFAYRKIIASCYSDRAVMYRLAKGYSEAEVSMAVLFMPMIKVNFSGVLYTRDPQDGSADRMLINVVPGSGANLVRDQIEGKLFLVNRKGEILGNKNGKTPDSEDNNGMIISGLSSEQIKSLINYGRIIEKHFGGPQDIEWIIDDQNKIIIVQSRPLRVENGKISNSNSSLALPLIISGGTTIFPGRAVGVAKVVRAFREIDEVPEGSLLIIRQATPALSTVLPFITGLIAEYGNPAGHAATLVREFKVPCVFGMRGITEKVEEGKIIGLDATYGKVFEGNPWPDMEGKSRRQISHPQSQLQSNIFHERILKLNLTDPLSANFNANRCKSIHDIIRFTHEKAVAAMFVFGDQEARRKRYQAKRLLSNIPLNFYILDLEGALPQETHERENVSPEEIHSIPFQALWRGINDPRVSWAGRTGVSFSGFFSVMTASMYDPRASIRRMGEYNYIIVAPDYINLNARLAYHFTMIDALISDIPEYNYVNFRFRGGGAQADRRNLRARFLAEVLLRSNFRVDQRGDLVTAWIRRYPRESSEKSLSLLGRLMACARQLDMLMENEQSVHHFVQSFLEGNYQAFV